MDSVILEFLILTYYVTNQRRPDKVQKTDWALAFKNIRLELGKPSSSLDYASIVQPFILTKTS